MVNTKVRGDRGPQQDPGRGATADSPGGDGLPAGPLGSQGQGGNKQPCSGRPLSLPLEGKAAWWREHRLAAGRPNATPDPVAGARVLGQVSCLVIQVLMVPHGSHRDDVCETYAQ